MNCRIFSVFKYTNNHHIEVKEEMMGDFLQAIQSSEINLFEDYMKKYMLQAPNTLEKGTSDCFLLVYLEFIHNQPCLKRENPAIPG